MNVSGVSQKRTALVKIKDQNGTVVVQKPVGANGAYTITNSDAVGVNRLKPGTTYTCELYWEEYVNGNFEYQNPLSVYATTQGTGGPTESSVKQKLIAILKNYPGYNVVNDSYSYSEIVNKFLLWYNEYHQGQYLDATYLALPSDYRLTALDHWADMASTVPLANQNAYFKDNLLPESYYGNIPNVPTYDSTIGTITNENKYSSTVAKNYYTQYYFPIDAFNEVYYANGNAQDRNTIIDQEFKIWARIVYGSSASEQGEEFAVGLLSGLAVCSLKTAVETIEGIYTFFKEKQYEQLPALVNFLAKATVSPEYQIALVMMIEQAVQAWKTEYNNADPYYKGGMIGDLIGQVFMAVTGAAETAQGVKAFVKGGGFLNAFRGVVQAVRRIRTAISNSIDELGSLITKFYSKADGFIEVEYASVGRMRFQESQLIEGSDIIGQQRYKNFLEAKWVESEGSLIDDAAETLIDGQQYAKNGRIKVLKPDITYTSNGYTYSTDSLGRIKTASGKLKLQEAPRNDYAQSMAGRIDRLSTDQGGHLIGSRFNGSGNLDNLVPMNSNLNQGAWKTMENVWDTALAAGKEVSVNIQAVYQGVSQRPTDFIVEYFIDGVRTIKNFSNVAGG